MKPKRWTIGIVGGLCPLATADIYLKAMKQVKANRGDQDYPDIIISAALEQEHRGNRFDDTPGRQYDMSHRILYIYQVARELKTRGVDKILVPDFLSYSYAHTISDNIKAPLVDIVAILADAVKKRWPEAKTAGLLTTRLAIQRNIFEGKFAKQGIRLVYPDPDVQDRMVMEAVYGPEGVKRGVFHGTPGEQVRQACQHLYAKGADVVVSAITELPLIERHYYPEKNYLDGNEAIAWALINNADRPAVHAEKYGTIGILGGLGPAATVDLFDKIVKHTPAACDQDHLKVVVENNPQIPDRTAALQGKNQDPRIAMLATAEKLKASGADFIIVPCNTAHFFLKTVQQHIGIPILSMIEETAEYITAHFSGIKKAGLLATTGTVDSGVYKDPLNKRNIELLLPPVKSQKNLVMEAIYGKEGVKAGNKIGQPRVLLLKAIEELLDQGAELIIMGCTEIPLALKAGDAAVPLIDPTDILAQSAVRHAMNVTCHRASGCS